MTRPRTKPYTEAGIRRLKCVRCGKQGYSQWQICADGNQYRVLCKSCDVAVNRWVMAFAFNFGNEHDEKMAAYTRRVFLEGGRRANG